MAGAIRTAQPVTDRQKISLLCRILGHKMHTFDHDWCGVDYRVCWRWGCRFTDAVHRAGHHAEMLAAPEGEAADAFDQPIAAFDRLIEAGGDGYRGASEDEQIVRAALAVRQGDPCVERTREADEDRTAAELAKIGPLIPQAALSLPVIETCETIEAANARIAELEGALEPFVNALSDFGDSPTIRDGWDIWESGAAMNITFGDLRRATAIRNLSPSLVGVAEK